jgi:hypothetical protein
MVGLHPFVGFGMFAVDVMLFSAESASLGITWPISIAIAAVLTIGCVLIQKYGMGERWGLALGKGIIVGILTAIPTPIPSIINIFGGVFGTVALLADGKKSSVEEKN